MLDSSDPISDIPVSPELLRGVVVAINDVEGTETDSLEACVQAIIELLLSEGIEDQQQLVELGVAICARLIAFAAFMKSDRSTAWLGRAASTDTSGSIEPAIIEAMARIPLRAAPEGFQFDSEEFLGAVLTHLPSAGSS